MIEETPQTQRSICDSYAKDLTIAFFKNSYEPRKRVIKIPFLFNKDFDPFFNSDDFLNIFDKFADHIYDHVMKDQLKPMSDAQLIKIEALLRLVKPDPERLKHIEAHLFKLNIKEASELIEELLKMKPSESGANRMVDRYSETAESVSSDVRKAVERDGN